MQVESLNDDHLRSLIQGALDLYSDFDEIYRPHVAEAVLRQLPPDFDRRRVDRMLEQMLPYQM